MHRWTAASLSAARPFGQSAMMLDVLEAAGGAMRRHDLLKHASRHVIEHAVRSGRLSRPFPQVYALPGADIRRAALCYVGAEGVLSHMTALAFHGLSDQVEHVELIHVDGPRHRHLTKAPGLVLHRREQGLESLVREGFPVRRLEMSLVDSWNWLARQADPLRRTLLIEAVGRRLTTPARILDAIADNVADRQQLVRLANLLGAGCRSELELWGFDRVFRDPDLPVFERDVPVDLGGHTVYLDMLERETLTNVELDGRHWHTSEVDRERDLRRDAALAARGYLVVRVSGARLHREPDVVRREIAAIIAARRSGVRSAQPHD